MIDNYTIVTILQVKKTAVHPGSHKCVCHAHTLILGWMVTLIIASVRLPACLGHVTVHMTATEMDLRQSNQRSQKWRRLNMAQSLRLTRRRQMTITTREEDTADTIYTHMYIYCTHVHTHTHIHTQTHRHTYTDTYTHIHTHTHTHIYIYIYIYIVEFAERQDGYCVIHHVTVYCRFL